MPAFDLTRRSLLAALPGASRIGFGAGTRPARPARNTASTLAGVNGLITPVSRFFVRDHFDEPDLSTSDWKLAVEGHVAQRLEITFSDLLLAPAERLEATLECAGNGARGFAVSTGLWKGVPLAFLLAAASPRPGAAEVLLEASDEGSLFTGAPRAPYTRIFPIARALEREALVAYSLNGQMLPRANGFPARALLPGWYAMDSVKWLRRIVVLQEGGRPPSYRQAGMEQVYIRAYKGEADARPLGRLQVKSAIAFPEDGSRLPAGRRQIWGFGWGGEQPLRRVMLSMDGGQNWLPARLDSKPDRLRWTRWSFDWEARAGDYALLSRAEDEGGNVQPLVRDPRREDLYEVNQCARVTCSVR